MEFKAFLNLAGPHFSRLLSCFYFLPIQIQVLGCSYTGLRSSQQHLSPASDHTPPCPGSLAPPSSTELLLIFRGAIQMPPALRHVPCHVQAVNCSSSVLPHISSTRSE